jgi:hypothetical protein
MPIKKIEIDGLNPEHPLATVIDEINANLDNVIEHINGIDAETGVVGATGAKGDKGEPGQQGIEGPAGKDGKDGIDGKDGKDGSPGLDGRDGKDGLPGEQGPAGKDGKDGNDGQPGRDGLPGRDGVDGKDGKDGLPGIQGPKGEAGAQGVQGLPGKDGKDGLPGTAGKDGLPGATGSQGVAGPAGVQGPVGPKGDKGDTGPVGSPGAMNYKVYAPGRVTAVNAIGRTILSTTFTSTGNPVMIIVTGDANPTSPGYIVMQIFRNSSAIGMKVQAESLNANVNVPYCVQTVDTPPAGTYTYSMQTVTAVGGNWDFGEQDGPTMTIVELTGAIGPTAGTANQVVYKNSSNAAAGSDSLTFDGTKLTVPYLVATSQGGDEGGEIMLGKPATNTSLGGNGVVIDVFQNRLRIFEQGGSNRGAYVDLTTTAGAVGTPLNRGFASGYVDAGQFVTLDNLKFSVTTGGARGLCCATVTGTATLSISANYAFISGDAGTATTYPGSTMTTTPSGSWFGWSFPNAGDGSTYLVNDYTNQKFYRVTLMIGAYYLKNFISIERLY